MSQRLDPSGLQAAGWTLVPSGGTAVSKVDDGASANDSDYIQRSINGGANSTITATLSSPPSTPNGNTCAITVRARGATSGYMDVYIELQEWSGDDYTVRGFITYTDISSSFTDLTLNGSGISDWGSILRVSIRFTNGYFDPLTALCSWIKADVPDPASSVVSSALFMSSD